jgi:hypothetical protein
MRGWLGSINFIAGHIPQVSRVLKPFFKMVGEVGRKRKKKAPLAWTDELLQLFAGAKEWIARNYQPVMLPDPTKPWRMYTDASRDGMGAALLQVNPATQRWEPVGFYSTLWALPKSYGVRDLELKAVHESVKHWKGYLRFGLNPLLFTLIIKACPAPLCRLPPRRRPLWITGLVICRSTI